MVNRIFNVTEDDQHTLVKELRGHEGPVWMVSWVHPMFGSMLASCSHDKKVIIWKETAVGALRVVDRGVALLCCTARGATQPTPPILPDVHLPPPVLFFHA